MKRLVMFTLFPLALAGCGDDSAIPRPGQNMEQQVQTTSPPAQPKSTPVEPLPSTNQQTSSAPAFQTEVKDAYGKAKQKTRKLSGSLAGSAKSWTKMNKDRIKANDKNSDVTPKQ